MTDKKNFRVFATFRIGDPAENRLRERGYELEVFQGPRGLIDRLELFENCSFSHKLSFDLPTVVSALGVTRFRQVIL